MDEEHDGSGSDGEVSPKFVGVCSFEDEEVVVVGSVGGRVISFEDEIAAVQLSAAEEQAHKEKEKEMTTALRTVVRRTKMNSEKRRKSLLRAARRLPRLGSLGA